MDEEERQFIPPTQPQRPPSAAANSRRTAVLLLLGLLAVIYGAFVLSGYDLGSASLRGVSVEAEISSAEYLRDSYGDSGSRQSQDLKQISQEPAPTSNIVYSSTISQEATVTTTTLFDISIIVASTVAGTVDSSNYLNNGTSSSSRAPIFPETPTSSVAPPTTAAPTPAPTPCPTAPPPPPPAPLDALARLGPIDVVYSWVNGSDPEWAEEKNRWQKVYANGEDGTHTHLTASSTTANRFLSLGELKYSLRAIKKNAPWVRHIFIVTADQTPSWLNTSDPDISVISHKSFFRDQKHLPTYNSAAIEANLHLIRGLSNYFLYLNDDFFIMKPTVLEDFISPSGIQKFFWDYDSPDCASGCSYNQIGNGQCNAKCMTRFCEWDGGDCDGHPEVERKEVGGKDSFWSSLIYTNRMLDKNIGNSGQKRKVVRHVPLLINRQIMTAMQQMFKNEYDTTSANKFRGENDVQYAFAYHNFLKQLYQKLGYKFDNSKAKYKFMMMTNNMSKLQADFRSVRDAQFMCMNNDMKKQDDAIIREARAFFEKKYPEPSDHELLSES